MYDNLPMHHRTGCWASLFTVSVIMAFLAGYWTSQWRDEDRVCEQSTERFHEFIRIGIDLGIITVDEDKLNEAICAGSEAEWEDRDASEWVDTNTSATVEKGEP